MHQLMFLTPHGPLSLPEQRRLHAGSTGVRIPCRMEQTQVSAPSKSQAWAPFPNLPAPSRAHATGTGPATDLCTGLLFPHTGSASTIGTPLLIPLQVLLKFLAAPINPSDINQLEGAGGTAPLRGDSPRVSTLVPTSHVLAVECRHLRQRQAQPPLRARWGGRSKGRRSGLGCDRSQSR